jgi:hypothetical protein
VCKPPVLYRTDRLHLVQVGSSAIVVPMAHPSPCVTGDGETPVRTSTVTRVDSETGEFWTENTHYMPWSNEGNLS